MTSMAAVVPVIMSLSNRMAACSQVLGPNARPPCSPKDAGGSRQTLRSCRSFSHRSGKKVFAGLFHHMSKIVQGIQRRGEQHRFAGMHNGAEWIEAIIRAKYIRHTHLIGGAHFSH